RRPRTARARTEAPRQTRRASPKRPASGLPHGLQIIREEVVAELAPHSLAHVQGIPEVDAAPDAHLLVLLRHLLEAAEAALQADVRHVGHRQALAPGPEDGFQDASRGTRVDPRLGRLFG